MESIDNAEELDYSRKKLKKLNKCSVQEAQNVKTLILDDNELQRLDNIDSFIKLQKLSAVNNQLLRMYGVCRLHHLQHLNLSRNGILTIEGLKELVNLKWLCLAGNSIKTIEHLNTNTALEHLDLSENNITHINDLSFLKNLTHLFLHQNKINHLRQCERFLPTSLTHLTLANNNIEDLNEISQLVHLINLSSLSIANNPCVNHTINLIGFDYRPFVINWCLNVKTIDGYVVDAIESLRAEWLYSQGRGRHFRIGDHKELVQYLASVCPLTGEQLETEEDRKLRIILSKAQHHQQQLREQSSESQTPSPSTRKKLNSSAKHHSPRLMNSRANSAQRNKSPATSDLMSSSFYAPSPTLSSVDSVMTQSLDPSMLRQLKEHSLDEQQPAVVNSPLQALSKMVPVPESLMSPDYRSPSTTIIQNKVAPPPTVNNAAVINGSSNNVKSKSGGGIPIISRSPKTTNRHTTNNAQLKNRNDLEKKRVFSPSQIRKSTPNAVNNNQLVINNTTNTKKHSTSILRKSSSSDDESEVFMSKLQMIQMKAEEKRLMQKDPEIISSNSSNNSMTEDKVEQAAVFIQKMWRGYFARNRNKEVQEIFRTLQAQRAGQYIEQLTTDMETTKAALESERKIQMLQTEAISALWKQMSALQPAANNAIASGSSGDLTAGNSNEHVVKELTKTCSVLQSQIQQLQSSMQDIIKVMSVIGTTQQSSPAQAPTIASGMATQTEIVAVHTPQGEDGKLFPFQKQLRPSTLPLPPSHNKKKDNVTTTGTTTSESENTNCSELEEYADHLVHGVIKTASDQMVAEDNSHETEITVTDTTK